MSTTCGMLQLAARALDSPSPGEVLAQVNETLVARIPSNMFATCYYAILNPKRGHLVYANAGHDLPYLQHGGQAKELRARGMPLGLMPASSYEEKEIVLDDGESVLFYSDGLVEAHDPEGQMFSFPRVRALVAEHTEEGALGRHHPSDAPMFLMPKLNFVELRQGEVRRTHSLRHRVNRASVVEALEYVPGEAAYLALR